MIQITPHMKILVAVEPVDFRRGLDGLAAVCRQALKADPLSGALFVFTSRRRHAINCLVYDGQGFWLCQKRLSKGKFTGWPKADGASDFLIPCVEEACESLRDRPIKPGLGRGFSFE